MNIVIVGVGALGSHLVQFLRNEDATLTVIDFDRVDSHNVDSQFHGKPSVGKKKVDALKQSMNFLYGRKVNTVGHKLTDDNVLQLLGDADLVIDCLDNGEGRRVIQRFVRDHDIACLHGALTADGAFGRVVWTLFFTADDAEPGKATCEDGNHLPFIVVVASYLALAAQRFLQRGEQVNFNIYQNGASRF